VTTSYRHVALPSLPSRICTAFAARLPEIQIPQKRCANWAQLLERRGVVVRKLGEFVLVVTQLQESSLDVQLSVDELGLLNALDLTPVL
jgi:hypothetical protein